VDPKPLDARGYWRANLKAMSVLLTIWLVVSCVLSIILVEPLNSVWIGGFPLGFWFAHQGSMYAFVVLIWVYAFWMDRIDKRYGLE
jgi:putative solute:sodium symporter small subunit